MPIIERVPGEQRPQKHYRDFLQLQENQVHEENSESALTVHLRAQMEAAGCSDPKKIDQALEYIALFESKEPLPIPDHPDDITTTHEGENHLSRRERQALFLYEFLGSTNEDKLFAELENIAAMTYQRGALAEVDFRIRGYWFESFTAGVGMESNHLATFYATRNLDDLLPDEDDDKDVRGRDLSNQIWEREFTERNRQPALPADYDPTRQINNTKPFKRDYAEVVESSIHQAQAVLADELSKAEITDVRFLQKAPQKGDWWKKGFLVNYLTCDSLRQDAQVESISQSLRQKGYHLEIHTNLNLNPKELRSALDDPKKVVVYYNMNFQNEDTGKRGRWEISDHHQVISDQDQATIIEKAQNIQKTWNQEIVVPDHVLRADNRVIGFVEDKAWTAAELEAFTVMMEQQANADIRDDGKLNFILPAELLNRLAGEDREYDLVEDENGQEVRGLRLKLQMREEIRYIEEALGISELSSPREWTDYLGKRQEEFSFFRTSESGAWLQKFLAVKEEIIDTLSAPTMVIRVPDNIGPDVLDRLQAQLDRRHLPITIKQLTTLSASEIEQLGKEYAFSQEFATILEERTQKEWAGNLNRASQGRLLKNLRARTLALGIKDESIFDSDEVFVPSIQPSTMSVDKHLRVTDKTLEAKSPDQLYEKLKTDYQKYCQAFGKPKLFMPDF